MAAKKQINFKVSGVLADAIQKEVDDGGWGTTSEFCATVIADYIKRKELLGSVKLETLETLKSEEGRQLINQVLDQVLIQRAMKGIDPNQNNSH